MRRPALVIVLACLVAACGNDSTPSADDAGADRDPLDLSPTAVPGSLDDLHARVIAPRCSGQPGLCHNGQFEPNLSTPALAYAYLVNRPGIEKSDELRVKPGDSAHSLIVDKLRFRNGVATQMPLGAEPLAEDDIRAIEAWIDAGALRAPGADPAPVLDNPPKRPEIGVFDAAGKRLDGTGPIQVAAGTTLILRHSVQDFETPDAEIPFAAVILGLADGKNVIVNAPSPDSPQLGVTTFDASGPLGKGDRLNYRFSWTIPATLPVFDPATKARTTRPASGQTVSVLAIYIDGATPGIVALDFSTTPIQIQ
ncbi:MAG TPA: hypothetical protein VFQ53_08355 [Kofleriaceae bacterium]|nr:hypothetical protein [Kofleriaceae bacterium]